MKHAWLVLGVIALLDCAPAQAHMTVYAVHALARVRPRDRALTTTRIAIGAARNEYEPLQVVVRAGRNPVRGVRASITDLEGPDGAVIASSNVAFYREHYVNVAQATPKSQEGKGWYPDALVPFAAIAPRRAHGKARFGGAPFDVDPNLNQPVWVDVYIPRDARAGAYSGVITVSADGELPREITVDLTVWDFTLPDTPSMRSNFGKLGTDIADAHGVQMNSPEFLVPEWYYGEALAAHRVSPIIPNTIYPRVGPDGSIDPSRTHAGLQRWMDTFHVTGFPLRLLGDDPAGRDRARNLTHLRAMYAYLEQHGWEKMAYVYVLDEPEKAADYEEVRRRARLVHEAEPDIKVLCTEQPTPERPQWGTLVGSVDIWVPQWSLFDEAAIHERLRAGEEVWTYPSPGRRGQETPFWAIDFPLLNYRVPMWLSWRYGLKGILYWSPVWWSETRDMWKDPATKRVGRDVYNGEGALFYPGVDAGIDGPVVSMRLKQIREGLEDYEYLKLLAEREGNTRTQELVREVASSWTEWNRDAGVLYRTREEIARRITAPR